MRRDEERRQRGDSRDLDDNIRSMRKDEGRHRNLEDDGRSRGLDMIPEERHSRRPRDEMRRQNEGEGRGRRYLHEDERRSRSRDRALPKSPPPKRRLSRESPEKVTATVGESTAAKPTTPPGSPGEEVCSIVIVSIIIIFIVSCSFKRHKDHCYADVLQFLSVLIVKVNASVLDQ